ncbi:MAG: ZIP family metal transporter [Candidatus Aenigmatarchaeota archaeon]
MELIFTIILLAIAGPVIGSIIGVSRKPSKTVMYAVLSFAAGVMISISFLELLPESIAVSGILFASAGLTIGFVVMYILDKSIPHIHPELCSQEGDHKLKKTATFLLIGIFLHNFPEGLAMGVGSVTTMSLSLVIAIAICIHDIPEGICTSAPYYYVTKKRLRTFLVSSSTAIPTVLGFLASYYFLQSLPDIVIGLVIAATAGLMVYISADELIPTSCSNSGSHATIFSFMLGAVLVMMLGML